MSINWTRIFLNGGGILPEQIAAGAERALSFPGTESAAHREACFRALRNDFVASARAVRLAHEIDPDNHVGCMIAHGANLYAHTCNPDDVLANIQALQLNEYLC